jgi:hypothetical protein
VGKLVSLWVGRHAQLGDGGGDTRAGTAGEVDQGDRAGDGALAEHGPEVPSDGGAADVRSAGAAAHEGGPVQGFDLPDFFGPPPYWKLASVVAAMPQDLPNAAGVCFPRLECGRTSL